MGQPILEVEHLKKSYVNNVPILDDVSFSLQKGEVAVSYTHLDVYKRQDQRSPDHGWLCVRGGS